MFEQLEDLEQELERLEAELPGIYASGDRRASRDAGRRHAELKPLVGAYQEWRAAGNDVKFGFVTSESTPEMKEQAEAAGALFFIVKPFSAERFDEVFAPILG